MTNPLDRSLNDMRNEKEIDNMVITEDEVGELEEFGALLAHAFDLSGEPPALAEIEYADESVPLPARSSSSRHRIQRRSSPAHQHRTAAVDGQFRYRRVDATTSAGCGYCRDNSCRGDGCQPPCIQTV